MPGMMTSYYDNGYGGWYAEQRAKREAKKAAAWERMKRQFAEARKTDD